MKTRKVGPASSALGKQGHRLFNDNPKGKSKVRAGYGNALRARQTIKRLRGKPKDYQRQVAITMFYRAKHHKYQTNDMREAMNVYKHFLQKL
jgi:hypothetical protein